MKGNVHCTFHTTPRKAQRFDNVNLTCIGKEGLVILSRGPEDDPQEVLTIEAVRIDILSDFSIDLEGFVLLDEEEQTFHRVFVIFAPILSEKEAA